MTEKQYAALGWVMVLAISILVAYYLVRIALYHL